MRFCWAGERQQQAYFGIKLTYVYDILCNMDFSMTYSKSIVQPILTKIIRFVSVKAILIFHLSTSTGCHPFSILPVWRIAMKRISCGICLMLIPKSHWWLVSIVSGNGVLLSGNKLLSEAMFHKAMWYHASMRWISLHRQSSWNSYGIYMI